MGKDVNVQDEFRNFITYSDILTSILSRCCIIVTVVSFCPIVLNFFLTIVLVIYQVTHAFLYCLQDESTLYIFLELASKGSLLNLYQQYHLRDAIASAYTRQILLGLKYLHDQNVVHRWVISKPTSYLMLTFVEIRNLPSFLTIYSEFYIILTCLIILVSTTIMISKYLGNFHSRNYLYMDLVSASISLFR